MTTTINLANAGKPHPVDPTIRYLVTLEDGRKMAEDYGLKEAILKGDVNVILPEKSDDGHIFGCRMIDREIVKEAWVKGFIGNVAREVGIDLFRKRMKFNGFSFENSTWHGGMVISYALSYLRSEKRRLEKEGKEKARMAGQTTWTAPGQFLIPDIGTVLKLTEDWTFRLIKEHRNDALTRQIGKGEYDWSNYGTNQPEFLVTVKAGSELGVDRIYIRKGAESFSSITFHLHKGSELEFNRKVLKAKGRFWAKLSDVNKMKVQIDTNTLAEN